MSVNPWSSMPGAQAFALLQSEGWRVRHDAGTHRVLERAGWPDLVYAFRDDELLGPGALARLARHAGLAPEEI